jgi:phage FluMu protein Com
VIKANGFRTRPTEEVRCAGCGILLATLNDGGLTVRRGELQITVDGRFHASIVCYRPRCRTLNVLNVKTKEEVPDKVM